MIMSFLLVSVLTAPEFKFQVRGKSMHLERIMQGVFSTAPHSHYLERPEGVP